MPKTAIRTKNARRRTTSRAKVVLELNGPHFEIAKSQNVRAVTEVDSDGLVVHFGVPFRDELYRCDVIPSELVGYEIKSRSKGGVGIRLSTPWPKRLAIVCEAI